MQGSLREQKKQNLCPHGDGISYSLGWAACLRPSCTFVPDLFLIFLVSDLSAFCLFMGSGSPYSRDLNCFSWVSLLIEYRLFPWLWIWTLKEIFSIWSEPWDPLPPHMRVWVPVGDSLHWLCFSHTVKLREPRSWVGPIQGNSWYQICCVWFIAELGIYSWAGNKENRLNLTGEGS